MANDNVIAGCSMVSADHFAQELRALMSRAAKHGSIDIVINSGNCIDLLAAIPAQCTECLNTVMQCVAK
jgi:hypothetical protein